MKQKILIIVLIVLVIMFAYATYHLAGTTNYYAQKYDEMFKQTLQEEFNKPPDKPIVTRDGFIKTYQNEKYGYEIQYPSFLTVDDSNPKTASFSNKTCLTNDKLCILGIDALIIQVSNNDKALVIDQIFEESKNYIARENVKKLRIFPRPENFKEDEMIEAVRYEFPEIPKQAKGGYGYIILRNDKIFYITILMGDTTLSAHNNEHLFKMTKDTYDPLGDMMMRTFRFVK